MDDVLAVASSASASAAADLVGVTVSEVSATADLGAVATLLQRVWRAAHPAEIASASLLRTFSYSGNYVAGAYRGDRLIGAAVGFFGAGFLHSYVAGVEPGGLGKGVGFALKQHQRAWALARGVREVHWTYDPLVLRNAYFNLHKLGATVTCYLPEFYGPMSDGINSGDLSDRLYVVWPLDSPHASAAAEGRPVEIDPSGAVTLVDRSGDEPAASPTPIDPDAARVLVAVPEDVEALRDRDPAAALRWRHAVRDALGGLMDVGWRVAGIARDGRYLLERSP